MAGLFFLFIAVVISVVILFKRLDSSLRDVQIMSLSALLLWIIWVAMKPLFAGIITEALSEMMVMLLFSFGLSAVLMLVRNLRPVLFQYPYFLTFSPFLITVAFILVAGSNLISDIMFMSVQAVLIISCLFIILGAESDKKVILKSIVSTLFLSLAFILFWFLDSFILYTEFLWQFFAGIGIVMNADVITTKSIHKTDN